MGLQEEFAYEIKELLGEIRDVVKDLAKNLKPKKPPVAPAPPPTTGQRIAAETVEYYTEVACHALPKSLSEADVLRRHIAFAIDKAIADERKACEEVAALFSGNGYEAPRIIADRIRARQ